MYEAQYCSLSQHQVECPVTPSPVGCKKDSGGNPCDGPCLNTSHNGKGWPWKSGPKRNQNEDNPQNPGYDSPCSFQITVTKEMRDSDNEITGGF